MNADDQVRDPDSLHAFIRTLISRYRASPEIGWGELRILEQPYTSVLAHRVTAPLGSMVALHNFSSQAVTVPLTLEGTDEDTRLVDLLQDATTPVSARGHVEVELGAYGYRWMRVIDPGSRRITWAPPGVDVAPRPSSNRVSGDARRGAA